MKASANGLETVTTVDVSPNPALKFRSHHVVDAPLHGGHPLLKCRRKKPISNIFYLVKKKHEAMTEPLPTAALSKNKIK